jgi:hypothetical protein
MKTKTITLYTAQELKDRFPDAFRVAFQNYQDRDCTEIPWQDETIDSLKEIVKDAGLKLRDYSLGAYNRGNFITVEFRDGREDAEQFTGGRALAWLENNLLCKYRIPFVSLMGSVERRKRLGYMKNYSTCHPIGSWNFYEPGRIEPCPATGYCADESYLEYLTKSLRSGDTLKEAFEGLADVCMKLLEEEDADNRSEERFLENAEANGWEFTDAGKLHV